MEYYPKKSLWKWILLYAIIAVLAYSGVYYFFFYPSTSLRASKNGADEAQNYQTQKQPQVQNNETAGWKAYTNDEYGFEFKYPSEDSTFTERPDLNKCDDGTDLSVQCKVFANNDFILQIIPHSLDEKAIHKLDGSVGKLTQTANPEIIGGKQGYVYGITSSTNYNISGFMVPLTNDSYLEATKNFKGPGDVPPWKTIISTFKFTK